MASLKHLILPILVAAVLWLIQDIYDASDALSRPDIISKPRWKNSKKLRPPGAEFSNIFWLVQVTDLHISSYRNFHIENDLLTFFNEIIPAVNPKAVVISGDLTDAKLANVLQSHQVEVEWEAYRRHIASALQNSSAVWLDLPGNHDKFDVSPTVPEQDLYSKYSPLAHRYANGKRSAIHKIKVDDFEIGLGTIDATQRAGLDRPFNFFGELNATELFQLHKLDTELNSTDFSIWFGHYPSMASIHLPVKNPRLVGDILTSSAVYACGHFHTLHGMEDKLWARQAPLGQLELELADFQKAGKFRIMAIDHLLFSFVDTSLHNWPIILVTNPKPALFGMPNFEDLDMIGRSTHIRVLAFSPVAISSVDLSLDGVYLGMAQQASLSGPLFTMPWSPKSLDAAQLHLLTVTVVDSLGRSKSENISFSTSLDLIFNHLVKTHVEIGGPLGSLVLSSKLMTICQDAIQIAAFGIAGLLLASRTYPSIPLLNWLTPLTARSGTFLMSLILTVYPPFGVWFMGEMATGRYGIVFSRGIYLLYPSRSFVNDSVTAYYGILQYFAFQLPLLLLYAPWLLHSRSSATLPSRFTRIVQRFFFQIILIVQIWWAYGDAVSYGWTAFVFSPLRTWSCVAAVYFDRLLRRVAFEN